MLLKNEKVELHLAPEQGGAVASFRWSGLDIFHTRQASPGALAMGCFPLAPFSGRIAQGRFAAPCGVVELGRNHPVDPGHPHALHGFDWLSAFDVVEASPARAELWRRHDKGAWPWAYETFQVFTLMNDGFRLDLSVKNLSASPMPAGLGLHPFFPRASARLTLHVEGRWETSDDLIPTEWRALSSAPDWFGAREIDHCYTRRRGAIEIDWPSHRLSIEPSVDMPFTVVFAPSGADYFCVEPASHMPDALNRPEPPAVTGVRWLDSGKRWSASVVFAAGPANLHAAVRRAPTILD